MGVQLIDVTPTMNARGKIDWEMCIGTNCKNAKPYPDVTLAANSKGHTFVVMIHDPTNTGVKFSKDPLWIQPSTNGYPYKVIAPTDEISDVKLAKHDKTLVFVDHNKDAMDLTYQLNFVDAQNKAVTAIDPVIKNGGGGGGMMFSMSLLCVGLIGLAALISMVVSYNFGKAKAKKTASPSA